MAFPFFPQSPFTSNVVVTSGITQNAWTTLNSGAPAGTTGVLLCIFLPSNDTGAYARGVRETGSSDTFTVSAPADATNGTQFFVFVGVNSSGQFDYFTASANDAADAVIAVVAAFGPEAVFNTNWTVLSNISGTPYTNYAAGLPANAVAAILAVTNNFDTYLRTPSSTEDLRNNNTQNAWKHFLVGLNSGNFAASAFASTAVQVVGYFVSNYTPLATAVSRMPGTAGSYQPLSTSGDTSPIACWYGLNDPNVEIAVGISATGATGSVPYAKPADTASGMLATFVPGQLKIQDISDSGEAFVELGYWTASPPTTTTTGGGQGTQRRPDKRVRLARLEAATTRRALIDSWVAGKRKKSH